MADTRDEKIAQVKNKLAKLWEVQLDSLSDEELEAVAGGCSAWCCSMPEGGESIE